MWVAFGIGFLLADGVEAVRSGFSLRWSYYFTGWGYLLACILGGALLFGPVPLGRWLVTVLGGLLIAYSLLIWAEGGADMAVWGQLWCSAMIVFSAWSIFLAQRRKA
jgi:hypothetical protein